MLIVVELWVYGEAGRGLGLKGSWNEATRDPSRDFDGTLFLATIIDDEQARPV